MKSLQDILNSELKNIYAIEKQIQESFLKLEMLNTSKKLAKRIKKIQINSDDDFNSIKEILSNLEINPRNTTDSILAEILKNIDDIRTLDIPDNLKQTGILSSLIRLNYYKLACYEVSIQIAKSLKMKNLKETLKVSRKKQRKQALKLKKTTKKLFKKS